MDNDFAITADSLYGTRSEEMFQGITSFIRRKYTRDLTVVDVAVMGIPFDTATTNRPGARFGPRAVREASAQLCWARPYGWGFDPFKTLACVDYGDAPFDLVKPWDVPAEIEAHARGVVDKGVTLLSIGGDHFVSYPVLKAHFDRYGPMALVHFDAHSDTWPSEPGDIEHGTMFYHAANDGLIVPEHSIQLGIRTHNSDRRGFEWVEGPDLHTRSADSIAEQIHKRVGDLPVYLTFDIDCIDPAFAPGTGTPVIGGPSTAQILAILRALKGLPIVGCDVVEVSPAYDHAEVTALAAATIAQQMLCLLAWNKGARPDGQG